MRRAVWLILGVAAVAVIGAGIVRVTGLLVPDEPFVLGYVERPAAGEVRPDFLDDGTPVWVIGYGNDAVGVLLGIDSHRPSNVGKLLWWCPSAEALENPEHGSKYDPAGVRIGGPAPTGLPRFEVTVSGTSVAVLALGGPPPPGTPFAGRPESERTWCPGGADTIAHSFDGWTVHDSPTEAVAVAPDGWILLRGGLVTRDGEVLLCALAGCDDAVVAVGVLPGPAGNPASPLIGERWLARIRDGEIVELVRVFQQVP